MPAVVLKGTLLKNGLDVTTQCAEKPDTDRGQASLTDRRQVVKIADLNRIPMDALSYPWQCYIPKMQQWARVDHSGMLPSDAQFVRIDTKLTAVSILQSLANLKGVSIGHATQDDLEFITCFAALTCVRLVTPRITSLAPLGALARLAALELDDPPTLAGLYKLVGLKCLVLRHFRRIKSLAPVGILSGLRAISMSTIPSWDASRRCLEIESLEPLSQLPELESLCLIGVKPLDGRLDPLQRLTHLKYLHISHEFQFQLEDYAALARALPNASGHCLLPYYLIPQLSLRCKRCGGDIVFLTGPRRRTRRQLCPICDEQKLSEHERQWRDTMKHH